jgi:hypothetical protein
MRIFTLAACCAAMGFFVLNCNNYTPKDTGGDSAAAIIDNFCDVVAAPFCEAQFACCPTPGVPGFWDLDNCKANRAQTQRISTSFCSNHPDREDLEAALRAGTVVFDQAQFDTCLALLKSLSAGGAPCTEAPLDALAYTCVPAFRGKIAPGDACTWHDWYLEDNVIPCKDGLCARGKCKPFLKTGDACFTRHQTVELLDDTFCNFFAGESCNGILAPVGEPQEKGTCAPRGDIGDACHPGNIWDCKSGTCDATGKCVLPDPMDRVCRGLSI